MREGLRAVPEEFDPSGRRPAPGGNASSPSPLPSTSDASASAIVVLPDPFCPMMTVTRASSGTSARTKHRTFSSTSFEKPPLWGSGVTGGGLLFVRRVAMRAAYSASTAQSREEDGAGGCPAGACTTSKSRPFTRARLSSPSMRRSGAIDRRQFPPLSATNIP